MRLGPFWWLEPIEYGFHKSQSTQRPSRPTQTRIIVCSRMTGGKSARARCQGNNAAAPVSRPALIRSRRPGWRIGGRSDMSRVFPAGLAHGFVVAGFRTAGIRLSSKPTGAVPLIAPPNDPVQQHFARAQPAALFGDLHQGRVRASRLLATRDAG